MREWRLRNNGYALFSCMKVAKVNLHRYLLLLGFLRVNYSCIVVRAFYERRQRIFRFQGMRLRLNFVYFKLDRHCVGFFLVKIMRWDLGDCKMQR